MNKILYFSTRTSQPCIQFKPIVQAVCSQLALPVQFIDATESAELAQRFGINSVPTIVVLDAADNVLKRHTGAIPKPQFQTMVAPYSANSY